jgi:hypothetical protein
MMKQSPGESRAVEADQTSQATERSALFGPRGRHRRPRPRKVLLAAGGFAVAAGVLSLVRLTPDSGVEALGTAEAEPRPDPAADLGRTADAAASTPAVVPVRKVSPSATFPLGGLAASQTPGTIHIPTTDTTTPPPAPALTPGAPKTPDKGGAVETPAPTTTTAAPPPAPTSTPPAPQPDRTDDTDVCVPLIGLCVDHLSTRR